jgi:signal transduction histidine kinase
MTTRTLRVLAVEDNSADANVLRRLLKKIPDFETEFLYRLDVETGRQALEEHEIDCRFLDYQLGQSTGLEVLTAIRESGNDVPIIVLTGAGNEAVAVEAMKRGAQDYMVKDDMVRGGMTPQALRRAVQNALGKVELERRIAEKQQELEQFVSVVAHDLQNPLSAVKDHVELIRDFYGNSLDETGRGFVVASIRVLERMSGMISSLLEFSRVGRSTKPLEPVDLQTVLDAVLSNLQPLIRERRTRIEIGTLPLVLGDPLSLIQLFQNLVANAIKFQDGGQAVVQIDSFREEDGWRVSVADNGIGIDSEHHDEIFAPFRRLHAGSGYEGSGIGLATCKRIVDQHRGRIWVESETGAGTVFHFTLPCASAGGLPSDSAAAGLRSGT